MGTENNTDPIRREVVAGTVALSLTAGVAAAVARHGASTDDRHASRIVGNEPSTAAEPRPTTTGSSPATPAPEGGTAPSSTSAPTGTAAPTTVAAAPSGGDLSPAELRLHVVRRLSFGPTPALLRHVETVGVDAFIDEQLSPGTIDDGECDGRLRGVHRIGDSASTIDGREQLALLGERPGRALADLRAAAIVRAVHSRRQLHEVVVEMWTDHFNIWGDLGELRSEKVVDDRDVIRRHALGRFADLLVASAHSPAMLRYLENHTSRAEHPNENYAREMLELHTLGAGNHSERDVRDAARVFTGWSIDDAHRYRFDAAIHDGGPATVAGWQTPGRGGPAGQRDGIDLLVHLARQPATAHNVASRIARRFVSDSPPAALVERLAGVYLAHDTAIRPVLEATFHSTEFRRSWATKHRRPFEYVAAGLRAIGADLDGRRLAEDRQLDRLLDRLGQLPFSWEAPDGFPDLATSWRSPNDVVGRWSVASLVAAGAVSGVDVDLVRHHGALAGSSVSAVADRIVASLAPLGASATARQAVLVASGLERAASAGELEHRSLAMMVAVALSSEGMHVR